MTEPIRIAMIMGKWVGGGVEAVVMNYYRHIDKSKIQFDFICDSDSTFIPYDEINNLGGKVFLCPPYQKPFKYHKQLKKILKNGNYKIVHSHINTLSVFSLWAAKRAKVPIRIAHSHSTTNKKEFKRNILKNILKHFSKMFATNYMACSEHAGRWMFGNKAFQKGKIFILNNAIDLKKYKFIERVRKNKRLELNISDDMIVIGHVGRLSSTKNQLFIIDVFKKYHDTHSNSKLLLIGQGNLFDKIKEKVKTLYLEDSVILLGQKDDVYNYYNAMDLFIFPSLYEGLGMAVIEAQVNKLPCIASTEVPLITKVSDGIKYISLNDNIDCWKNGIEESILKGRNISYLDDLKLYDIRLEKNRLENKYIELIEEKG